MSKLCYIDIETTGFDPVKNGIIQIAGIIEIDGEKTEEFNLLTRPFAGDEIEDDALEVNRITREDLELHPAPAKTHLELVEGTLKRYVNRYKKTDKFLLVGYNANFDAAHLRAWFDKLGDKYFGAWFWYPTLDVAVLAGHYLADKRHELENFKLATVAEYLDIAFNPGDLHDALADIRLTRQIYRAVTGQEGGAR